MVVVKAVLEVVVMRGRQGGVYEDGSKGEGGEKEAGEGEEAAKTGLQEPRTESPGLREGVGEWEGAGPEMGGRAPP